MIDGVALHPGTTHLVDVPAGQGTAIKRFRSRGRCEPEREWAALRLLAGHAPGLAPAPLRADLAGDPAMIEMSRLPGVPLGGAALLPQQAEGLADALERLWHAVPASRVTEAIGSVPNQVALLAQVRGLLAADRSRGGNNLVGSAVRAGASWIAARPLDRLPAARVVLGHGDPNLANYLQDGATSQGAPDRQALRLLTLLA
jgi:hypothetical protein